MCASDASICSSSNTYITENIWSRNVCFEERVPTPNAVCFNMLIWIILHYYYNFCLVFWLFYISAHLTCILDMFTVAVARFYMLFLFLPLIFWVTSRFIVIAIHLTSNVHLMIWLTTAEHIGNVRRMEIETRWVGHNTATQKQQQKQQTTAKRWVYEAISLRRAVHLYPKYMSNIHKTRTPRSTLIIIWMYGCLVYFVGPNIT